MLQHEMLASLLINSSHSCVMQMHWALMLYISEWKLSVCTAYVNNFCRTCLDWFLYKCPISYAKQCLLCVALRNALCMYFCMISLIQHAHMLRIQCCYISKYTLNSYLDKWVFRWLVYIASVGMPYMFFFFGSTGMLLFLWGGCCLS